MRQSTHNATTFALFLALVLAATAIPAHAAVILSPVAATASNTFGGDIAHTIDQSGLSPTFVSGVTDFDTFIASNPMHAIPAGDNAWAGLPSALPIDLDFDLGGTFSIGRLALWTSLSGFSIDDFEVFTASNAAFTGATNVGTFDANDTDPIVAQVFNLAPSTGSFLRLRILSNEGGPTRSANLSELAVEVAPAAMPEPGTLVLIGLAAGVLALRRRSRPA